MVKFLEAHGAEDLARMVAPRRAYRPAERLFRRTGAVPGRPPALKISPTWSRELERDGKGVPILIKQYLKTGGRLLGFNVDRRFVNALDALILVDLRNLPSALLERYLGKPGAAAFSAWHAIGQGAAWADFLGLTDESVCPALLSKDSHPCGAGAVACRQFLRTAPACI